MHLVVIPVITQGEGDHQPDPACNAISSYWSKRSSPTGKISIPSLCNNSVDAPNYICAKNILVYSTYSIYILYIKLKNQPFLLAPSHWAPWRKTGSAWVKAHPNGRWVVPERQTICDTVEAGDPAGQSSLKEFQHTLPVHRLKGWGPLSHPLKPKSRWDKYCKYCRAISWCRGLVIIWKKRITKRYAIIPISRWLLECDV